MDRISVEEAARRLGVSARRVRAMAAAGLVAARKVGRAWVVELDDGLPRVSKNGRPIASGNAWALLALLNGDSPEWVHPSARSRLRARARDSEWSLRALTGGEARADIHRLRLLPSDLRKLQSYGLVASGLWAKDRKLDVIGRPDEPVDGYVSPESFLEIERRFRPLESSVDPNAILRVPSHGWVLSKAPAAPSVVVAADLLDAEDPRVGRAARDLLRGAVLDRHS